MDQKTIDQVKVYLAEAMQQLLTLNKLLEQAEKELTSQIDERSN